MRSPTLIIAGFLALAAAVAWAAVFRTQSARHSGATVRSVLVLAFANLSGNTEEEYFSDGLTEELIENLTGIPGVRVVPRSTAFQFKGKAVDFRILPLGFI